MVPVLRHGVQFDAENACEYVLNYLKEAMKPDDQELMFWTEFNHKNYHPELLFQDESILSRMRITPWPFGNVIKIVRSRNVKALDNKNTTKREND